MDRAIPLSAPDLHWWERTYEYTLQAFEASSNHENNLFHRIAAIVLAVFSSIITFPIYAIGLHLFPELEGRVSVGSLEADPRAEVDRPEQVEMPQTVQALIDFYREKIQTLEIPALWSNIVIAGNRPAQLRDVFLEDFLVFTADLPEDVEQAGALLRRFYASMVHICRANDPTHPRPYHRGRVGFKNREDRQDCGWLSRANGVAHSSRIDYLLLRPIQMPDNGIHTHTIDIDPYTSRLARSGFIGGMIRKEKDRWHYHHKYDTGVQIAHLDLVELRDRLASVIHAFQTGEGANNDNPHWKYYNGEFVCSHRSGHEHTIPENRHNAGYHFITDVLTFMRFTWDESWLPLPVETIDDGQFPNLSIEPYPTREDQLVNASALPYIQALFPEVQGREYQGPRPENLYGHEIVAINIPGRDLLERMSRTDWRVIRILMNSHYFLIVRNRNGSISAIDNDRYLRQVPIRAKRRVPKIGGGHRDVWDGEGKSYQNLQALLQDYFRHTDHPRQQRDFRALRQLTFAS